LITADEEVFKLINSDSNLKKNIIFTGYVDAHELIPIYKMAEALIFPSFYEGFGLPPLEAMACGCPVIASNAASIPEACGDAALYFDPYSINDIAAKINHFINDGNVKNGLIQNGFQNIKRFSRENFSMNLIKVIDSLQ
jgi:glycosyltransferase involved in cell wall biosynthesis